MVCKLDVRKAILDKAVDELRSSKYDFVRTDIETVRITKAKNSATAFRLARDMVMQVNQSFNGHVDGFIDQISKYDPVTVQFKPSDRYINHVYNGIRAQDKRPNPDEADIEETYAASDTGPNTHNVLKSPTIINKGVFVKFVDSKIAHKSSLFDRLSTVRNQKEAVQRRGDLTQTQKQAELSRLNKKEKSLINAIYGSKPLGIKGIDEEIEEIANVADIVALAPYIESDLAKIEALVQSDDLDDLREARDLIEFYKRAGIFDWARPDINPFFGPAQMFKFDPATNTLSTEIADPVTKEQFEKWASRASNNSNQLQKKFDEKLVEEVNSNALVQKAYGTKLSLEEITSSLTGIRDADVFSMWVMDATSGLFSQNGILPQVMFATLQAVMEEKAHVSRDIAKRIDNILPKVEAALAKLDGGKHTLRGIGMAKAVSYNIYKDITKEGNETGALIQRFTHEYNSEEQRAVNTSTKAMRMATTSGGRGNIIGEYTRWRQTHSIIIDPSRIPEIEADSAYDSLGASGDAAYKQEMITLLGKNGYEEEVAKMKKLLSKFLLAREQVVDGLLQKEGEVDEADLSQASQDYIANWDNWNNPVKGVDHYHANEGRIIGGKREGHGMEYNSFVPRADKVNITRDTNTNTWTATPTGNSTGYYNETFKKIEGEPSLYEFYKIQKESCELIRDNTPYEIQQQMPAYTLMSLRQTAAEMLLDKNLSGLSFLSPAFRNIKDQIRESFGVMEQSTLSPANIDSEGRANYKVEDDFLRANLGAINARKLIERTKFTKSWNDNVKTPGTDITKVDAYTERRLEDFNVESLVLLAEYTHTNISRDDIKAGRLTALEKKVGDRVRIGRIIDDYAQHTVVQSQSFDLPKLTKYFTALTMEYAARQEALPMVEMMKHYYDKIQNPATNNTNKTMTNQNGGFQPNGLRSRAVTQMASQFDRTFLGKSGQKHIGELGTEIKTLTPSQEAKLDAKIAAIDRVLETLDPNDSQAEVLKKQKHKLYAKKIIPSFGKKIYSEAEKIRLGELREQIEKNPGSGAIEELEKSMAGIGKTRTWSAILNNILGWINILKLGYNVSSMVTNYLEGLVSNMILASSGQYFDTKEIYAAYHIMRYSKLKNISFSKGVGKDSVAHKTRALMDMFNVVVDSRNELQKSSHKSFTNKLEWLKWSSMNQRVEYVNQGVLMIASLRSTKIKGKDTAGNDIESSVWDAYGNDGKLKAEYRTPDNIQNWETLAGKDYNIFKSNLDNIIIKAHGNYSDLRGMMIKQGAGKILTMFKTWLPEALAWRFGKERTDILSGQKSVKGRYRSYTPGAAAIHGAIAGAAFFGFVGMGIGGAAGYIAAMVGNRGVDTGTSGIKDLLQTGKAMAMKAIGMPVNMTRGKEIIKDSDYYDKLVNSKFTAQDAQNMRANIAEIAMHFTWMLLILAVKAAFWDDDDEPDDPERLTHNLLMNKLTQLSSQAASFVDISSIYNGTIGNVGLIKFYDDGKKEVEAMEKLMAGDDLISSGQNAGESRAWNASKKLMLPGIFKGITTLGLEAESQKVYKESPFHPYFRSDETKDKSRNKASRAARKAELDDDPVIKSIANDDDRDKEVRKILDYELPTTAKLKKMDMTRQEYEDSLPED